MKIVRSFLALAIGAALLTGIAFAENKEAGKACEKKECCVKAEKDGKKCEHCAAEKKECCKGEKKECCKGEKKDCEAKAEKK